MNYLTTIQGLSGLAAVIFLLSAGPVWAQAGGHASVGLGHGEEGYLHLEEMIKHLEYSLKMPDASQDLRMHGSVALQHAKEALKHYDEAIRHASESLGRASSNPMLGGDGSQHNQEGSGGGAEPDFYGRTPQGEGSP